MVSPFHDSSNLYNSWGLVGLDASHHRCRGSRGFIVSDSLLLHRVWVFYLSWFSFALCFKRACFIRFGFYVSGQLDPSCFERLWVGLISDVIYGLIIVERPISYSSGFGGTFGFYLFFILI